LLALITRVHRSLYNATGGVVGWKILWMRILLLRHVGRKTGLERVIPLLYVEDGGRWIVAASNNGDQRHPAWWLNLEAHPEAEIQVGGESHTVRARLASPEESDQLWNKLVASYRYYTRYREGTARDIPLVILEPSA